MFGLKQPTAGQEKPAGGYKEVVVRVEQKFSLIGSNAVLMVFICSGDDLIINED